MVLRPDFDAPALFWDVMPTLAELAGVAPPSNTDGISFVPTLLGKGTQREHEFLYWEQPSGKKQTRAVRLANWKMVQPKPDGPRELYDLSRDIGETHDVAAEHADVMAQINVIIASQHAPERDYGPAGEKLGVKDFVR